MTRVNGILLLYRRPFVTDASTIAEHIDAFSRHSAFAVWTVNTEPGFPQQLRELQFSVVVLHYSIFGSAPFHIGPEFLEYLSQSDAYKVGIFQDEYHHCPERFDFIDRYRLDCVYTLIEPQYWADTYQRYTHVPRLEYCIPGYVSENLIAAANRLALADERRTVDVGYRARRLPGYMGKGAQEKHQIAVQFKERARDTGLALDIETGEEKRIYGRKWHRFLANCRGVLGVEAGTSVFDLEGTVRRRYRELMAQNPELSFEELSEQVLAPWEDRVPYRTISPRHFEAAAFRVCQILYEGSYSGILQPMVHYIPLKKDMSNFDEAVRLFRDPVVRRSLTEAAYRDLIASGRYSYRAFIEAFDRGLEQEGLRPRIGVADRRRVTALLGRDVRQWPAYASLKSLRSRDFPGRSVARAVVHAWRRWRSRRGQADAC